MKKDSKDGVVYSDYIKELFKDKRVGDKFTVDMKNHYPAQIRACIAHHVRYDYRTRFTNGVFTVQIISLSK